MMGDDIYSLFKHFIYGKFKYILMGDICQLEPIFDTKNNSQSKLPPQVEFIKNKGDLSLFFQNPNDYTNIELDKNMRAQNKTLNKIIGNMRLQVLNNKDFNLENNFELNIEKFKNYLDTDFIIICWKNNHVDFINNLIREWLNGGEEEMKQYIKYDKITLTKFYVAIDKETGKKVFLENGYRGTITNVKKIKYKVKKNAGIEEFVDNEEIEFDFFELTIDNEYIIKTINKDDEFIFNKWYKDMINKIKKLKQGEKEKDEDFKKRKIDYFKKVRSKNNRNCKLSFSFATTIHKSQGSSYDYVFVYNHFGVFYNQNRKKYTACSRARLELNIFEKFDIETSEKLRLYMLECNKVRKK
jgi:ATP-dependent exoDNAse (exonuclease V) alpha subunit